MTDDVQHVDVLIVGAGMVGLALACALPTQHMSVCVVDKHVPQPEQSRAVAHGFARAFDVRVSALTCASQQLLARIGAWPHIAPHAAFYTDMHVWDAEGTGSVHFSASDIHEAALGCIVENSVTQHALWGVLSQNPHVKSVFDVSVQAISEEDNGVRTVILSNGKKIAARLVVAADGAFSTLRELAQFDVLQWSYEHTAIVTTVKCEKPHQDTAWQRFTVNGPLAFLPLQDAHYCSIVWSQKTEEAQRLMALSDADFIKALERAFENQLGVIEACDVRAAFVLTQRHAKTYVKERIALVGDAAHTIHPLAGQGVNLGFLDVAALAQTLTEAVHMGADLGSLTTLKKFERSRQTHNLMMMGAMEGFKRLFEQDALPVRLLRNVGLTLFDRFAPLKSAVIKRAMGLEGDLPEMVKR